MFSILNSLLRDVLSKIHMVYNTPTICIYIYIGSGGLDRKNKQLIGKVFLYSPVKLINLT